MITFTYSNAENVSLEEIEYSKNAFIDRLGIFKDEFDNKNGHVNIDFAAPIDSNSYFSFSVSPPHSISEFIFRWNEWIKARRPI